MLYYEFLNQIITSNRNRTRVVTSEIAVLILVILKGFIMNFLV